MSGRASAMLFIDNKYTRWYYQIIVKKAITNNNVYSETHHIIPRSMNGSDSNDNLISLSAREHFICHWLLTKMTTGNDRVSMIRAFWMMRAENKNQKRYINSRAYQSLKEEYALIQSDRISGENNPMAGDKFYRSEQGEAKRLAAITGRVQSESEKKKQIEAMTGKKREKFSDEWIESLSKARQGNKNPRYGITLSDELKTTLSDIASDRTWIKKDDTAKRVKNNVLQSYLDDEWVIGRIEKPRKKRGSYKKTT